MNFEMNIYTISVSLCIIFWTSWYIYCRVGDYQALKIAKSKYGSKNKNIKSIRRMGLLSALWQHMYEKNNSPIIHAFEYGPASGYEYLKDFWHSFSKKYPNWRSIPVKINGRWFWIEVDSKDFNINDHVKSIQLKSINGNTQKALIKFVNENNMNKPFAPNRPYWEAYYITFTDKNEAYAYGRLTHAIGDGILLNKITELEHYKLWRSDVKMNPKKIKKKRKNKCKATLMTVYNFIKYLPFALKDLFSLWFESAPYEIGIHPNNNGKDQEYEFNLNKKFNIGISDKLSLTKIKKLGKKHNGTINDVVMTIFCHSVYLYIFKYICNNNEDKYNKIVKKYGKKLYLRFFTIFNMRSLMGGNINDLAKNYENGLSENDVSTVPIALPCGNLKFIDRFDDIHNLFYKLKNGPTPLLTAYMLKIGEFLIGFKFITLILGNFFASKCTFTLSNLIGPKNELSSGPNKSENIWNVFNVTNPTFPPLSCGIMSYVDTITFVMAADKNAINDAEVFMNCLNDVYQKHVDDQIDSK